MRNHKFNLTGVFYYPDLKPDLRMYEFICWWCGIHRHEWSDVFWENRPNRLGEAERNCPGPRNVHYTQTSHVARMIPAKEGGKDGTISSPGESTGGAWEW